MGLDISTYDAANWKIKQQWEDKYTNDFFETASEQDQDAAWDAPQGVSEDVPSEKYPDNINNRRYLRSSYNDGGFNSAVPNATKRKDFDYYGILAPLRSENDYDFEVNDLDKIAQARANAVECVEALEALRGKSVHMSLDVGPNMFSAPPTYTAEQAREIASEELEKNASFGAWSSLKGFFSPDGLTIVAAVPGIDVLGSPTVHLVYSEVLHKSYIDSAHVLVEFIDELAMLVKRDGMAGIVWSG